MKGGKDATAIGTVESQAGLIGYAGYFPGDTNNTALNNVLQVMGSDTDPTFNLTGGSFTVEALVRTAMLPATAWSGIVTKGDSAWRVARNSGTTGIQSAGTGLGSASNSLHVLNNDVWHYVALRYDSVNNLLTSVFDDVFQTSVIAPGAMLGTNAFPVVIGGNAQQLGREWQGVIDEVAIYTDALSDAAIASRISLLDTDPSAIDAVAVAYWSGAQATGSFLDAAGWDLDAPQTGDSVVIGKGGVVDFSSELLAINFLEVGTTLDIAGRDSDGAGQLNIREGYLRINGGATTHVSVGRGSGNLGVVSQSGGVMHVRGDDYQLGLDANGAEGRHLMTGGVLQVGDWVEDSQFTGGWFMTNDNAAGDDLSIGRFRSRSGGETTGVSTGVLDMSGDSIARVANDVFLDVGIGELYMTDNAVMHVGDDFRASSADYGQSIIEMSGSSRLKFEGRFAIADSNFTTTEMTMSGDSVVEIGMYMAVGGQDNLSKSGDGVLNIEGNARINVGAFLYRGDVEGNVGDVVVANRVADEQELYVGAGDAGRGSGVINQNGPGSLVSVGRDANVGQEAVGVYNLRGGQGNRTLTR